MPGKGSPGPSPASTGSRETSKCLPRNVYLLSFPCLALMEPVARTPYRALSALSTSEGSSRALRVDTESRRKETSSPVTFLFGKDQGLGSYIGRASDALTLKW